MLSLLIRERLRGTQPSQRNLFSGNTKGGVIIGGVSASNNIVVGNFIGVGLDGVTLIANSEGLLIQDGAAANRIGDVEPGSRNVIVGYQSNVHLQRGATGNAIQGNIIGLLADGSAGAVAELNDYGVNIQDSPGNLVGGTAAGASNVISGNKVGVSIQGALSAGNVIQGNLIGTTLAGGIRPRVANSTGIKILEGDGTIIGGTDPGAGNVVSGQSNDGIYLQDVSGTVVQGNRIGTDASGLVAFGNGHTNAFGGGGSGMTLSSFKKTVTQNLLGGPGTAGNLISGNLYVGLVLNGNLVVSNVVQGNFIGIDATGTNALGNLNDGVQVYGCVHTLIGGGGAGEGNVISANTGNGIFLAGYFGLGASNTVVAGNRIGVAAAGTFRAAASAAARLRHGKAAPADPTHFLESFRVLENVLACIFNYYADFTIITALNIGSDNICATKGAQPAIVSLPPSSAALSGGVFLANSPYVVAPDPWPDLVFTKADSGAGNALKVEGGFMGGPPGASVAVQIYAQSSLGLFTLSIGSIPAVVGPDGKCTFSATLTDPWRADFESSDEFIVGTVTIAGQTGDISAPIKLSPSVTPGTIQFAFTDPVITFPAPVAFSVVRTGSLDSASSVDWLVWQPTFLTVMSVIPTQPITGSVTFQPGESAKTFTIPFAGQFPRDGFQMFYGEIRNPTGGMLGEKANALVTVRPGSPTARPRITVVEKPNGYLVIEWDEPLAYLETAGQIGGPYAPVPDVLSPFTLAPEEIAKRSYQFMRLVDVVPTTKVNGTLATASGQPANNTVIRFGHDISGADQAGAFTMEHAPVGLQWIQLYTIMTFVNAVNGARDVAYAKLLLQRSQMAAASAGASLKIAASKNGPKTDCDCTPWCAIAGGMVDGVQQIAASGGRYGTACLQEAVVTITKPDGSVLPLPGHELFIDAPHGTWTVTSTTFCGVIGVTRTCTITLP